MRKVFGLSAPNDGQVSTMSSLVACLCPCLAFPDKSPWRFRLTHQRHVSLIPVAAERFLGCERITGHGLRRLRHPLAVCPTLLSGSRSCTVHLNFGGPIGSGTR